MTERNYDAALKEFSIAAQAVPNDREILETTGVLYRWQGRCREPLATFRRVQELDPRVPHHEVGQTALMLRHWHTATVEFRHALELDPDDVWIKKNLASVLMIGEGDFAAAKVILDTVPNPERDNRGLPSGEDVPIRWELFMLERDFAGAEKVLAEFPGEEFLPPFVAWKLFVHPRAEVAAGAPATA